MVYLYRIRPRRVELLSDGPTEEEGRVISDHFQYLKRLTAEGTVFLAGRTDTVGSDSFGIVIFEAGSEGDAEKIMEKDPAVSEGVMEAMLFPFLPALVGDLAALQKRN